VQVNERKRGFWRSVGSFPAGWWQDSRGAPFPCGYSAAAQLGPSSPSGLVFGAHDAKSRPHYPRGSKADEAMLRGDSNQFAPVLHAEFAV
jgi:hypothetical protein